MSSEPIVARDDRQGTRSSRNHEFDWQQVQEAIQSLRYGEVRIVVQDGLVIQIDRTEKQRVR